MVFREGRQRKETAQPQSWSTHPPRWRSVPPEQSQERHTAFLNQSNNLPMFYQQLSKQCFPGWKNAIPSSPKATAAAFILPSYWLIWEKTKQISNISPGSPKRLPNFVYGKYAKRPSAEAGTRSSLPQYLTSESLLIWSQGPKRH